MYGCGMIDYSNSPKVIKYLLDNKKKYNYYQSENNRKKPKLTKR